jgi:hypothetical protein
MTKECSKCKRILPLSEFSKGEIYEDDLQCWCRDCISEYQKKKRINIKQEAMIFFGGQCVNIDKNGMQCLKNVKDNLDELELSHPNNDGDAHRDLISDGEKGHHFYEALKKRGWDTDGYKVEVMCSSHHRSLDRHTTGKHNNPVWLKERYIDDDMTQREIAGICGVSQSTISNRLGKFGISK